MSKHTPGPWEVIEVDEFFSIAGGDGWVATMDNHDENANRANAPLIAAAPDLLAALDVALSFISDRAAKRVIVAAMAKARGETTDTGPGNSQHPTEGDG